MKADHKTLSDLIVERKADLRMTDRAICAKYGWIQQTFSAWRNGSIPRPDVRPGIAEFLGISADELDHICDQQQARAQHAEIAKVSDRKAGRFKFVRTSKSSHVPRERYSALIETNVMEPALLYGTRAWVEPSMWPVPGYDVFVHGPNGSAWLGRLVAINGTSAHLTRHNAEGEIVVENVQAIHPVVLAERIPDTK